ncbi:MAG: tetratricopeptide repeat protein, partial [Polyangiaceae bacterium]
LVLGPDNAALLYNLALALTHVPGQNGRAIDVLALIRGDDERVVASAAFLLARLLEGEGRFEDALKAVEAVFGERPENEDALLARARILEALGRAQEAEDLLRGAMAAGRKRIGVGLAGLMLRAGRISEAGIIASQALANSA